MEIFDYDNILLLPRKCRVESRSECDASTELGGRRFRIPVVPANMKTVVDESICLVAQLLFGVVSSSQRQFNCHARIKR